MCTVGAKVQIIFNTFQINYFNTFHFYLSMVLFVQFEKGIEVIDYFSARFEVMDCKSATSGKFILIIESFKILFSHKISQLLDTLQLLNF